MGYFQTFYIEQVLLFTRYQTIRGVLSSCRASFPPPQCFINRPILHNSVGFLHQPMVFTASIFQQLVLSFQFYLDKQLPSHSVLRVAYQEIYFELMQCEYSVFFLCQLCNYYVILFMSEELCQWLLQFSIWSSLNLF